MFNNVLNYVLFYVLIALSLIVAFQHYKVSRLETDKKNLNKAVSAYEELIKVVPFNRVVEERNENAEDEINATLNNVNAIDDGSYKL